MDIHLIPSYSPFNCISTNIACNLRQFQYCGSQEELGSSTKVDKVLFFVIASLLALLPIRYQNSGNLFQTHGTTLLLFIVDILVYAITLASYLTIPRPASSILGAFACGLLLQILVPPVGWLILFICVCIFVKLLYDSHKKILECFQQIFLSITQSTSQAFHIFCGWFKNSFQLLCRVVSRAFNRFLMMTANSAEQQGVEMAARVAT